MAKTMKSDEDRPNVTAETTAEHYRILAGTRRDMESARGAHRAAVKAAKKAGINTAALLEAMRLKREDDSDAVALYYRDLARYAAWINAPIGSQLGLFGDEAPVAQAVADTIEETDAYDVGLMAGRAGRNGTDNPYPPGSLMHQGWAQGWIGGQQQLANELRLAGKDEPAPKAPKVRGKRGNGATNPEDRPAA
jgi:hypothetical protein